MLEENTKCENCDNDHDGKYGSGRFCSSNCSRSFSTKNKRSLINEKVSKKLTFLTCINCKTCNIEFKQKRKTNVFCSNSCKAKYYSNLNKELYRNNAILNNLGKGNRNKYAHGWYESNFAGKVYLESSYEYKIAVELDKNNINWIRPSYLNWIDDNNIKHKYYADFYLIDYNIYLDPKNDYLIKKDTTKINLVKLQNNIQILILNKNELTWNIIKNKIS